MSLSKSGVTYLLGNPAAHGVGIYGAAKVREFLGWRSHPVLLEQFSHMELFSLSARDTVNIFSDFDRDGAARKLADLLKRRGYRCSLLDSWGESEMERLFHLTFTVQTAALRKAEGTGLLRPYFLGAKKQLEVSDAAIY